MLYNIFSLNGAWEMYYQEEKYTGMTNPLKNRSMETDAAGTEPEDSSSNLVAHAVPGYWEDMTEAFMETPFFRELKINPEYGLQQYPMAGAAPDMALPDVVGTFFYSREFKGSRILTECQKNPDALKDPVMLHFEGVQNSISVWINDTFVGSHEGYSTPFDIKVPVELIQEGSNTIVLSVSNHVLEGYAGEPVSGLTNRAANQYTGGITGDVEFRVYHSMIRDAVVLVSEDCRTATVQVELAGAPGEEKPVGEQVLQWTVKEGEDILRRGSLAVKRGTPFVEFKIDTKGLERWSPEDPKLYALEIFEEKNVTESCVLVRRFGIRRLTAKGEKLYLNGTPYYLRGICEHCYFPETVHPDHDAVHYRNIIRTIKKLGFNFIRFHTHVPEEEYLQAADDLGILLHIESPNNTTLEEWAEIVRFCRKHPSVVLYCCGNELLMDEPFIEHLRKCGEYVHTHSDALFSPMNAMRGLEYFWVEKEQEAELLEEPFRHHPRRIRTVGAFSDVFSSYPDGVHSYISLDVDPAKVDANSPVYDNKPRISHEICIDGSYTDLSLKSRYKGTRIGRTDMFESLERHLEQKGVLKKAPLYFRNSSEWQRRVRKYCFEGVRKSQTIAGYDFLGPVDTHWHTFGYDVGMMNEFYELKPGETVRNVRMYNSGTILLTDLGRKTNFEAGETLKTKILASHFGKRDLENARLDIRLFVEEKIIERWSLELPIVKNGEVSELYELKYTMPETEHPKTMKLYVTLDGEGIFVENEWELYLFPHVHDKEGASENVCMSEGNPVIAEDISIGDLTTFLAAGRDVLVFGTGPFASMPTTFRIALAGRTSGNLATVISDHPAMANMPHEGFCGWQFGDLLEGGRAVLFEYGGIPFEPVIEVVSTHKYVIRQSALFEFQVGAGKLLVCSLNFKESDPAARWLKQALIDYARSSAFIPKTEISPESLHRWAESKIKKAAANTNFAFNVNDKTAVRRK